MNRNLAYQKKWKFEQPKCTELEYITVFENQRKGLVFEYSRPKCILISTFGGENSNDLSLENDSKLD